tara:strand:+ start:280 stop:834 length:555 start_codon:yes stop_codon:yes gene_type:complete
MRLIGSFFSVTCLLLSVCLNGGCADKQSNAQRQRIAQFPPDFALEFFVDGKVDDTDPRLIRSKYLLQPNFSLHLSLGDQASITHYPSRFLKLRRSEFQQIVNVTQQANLMAEPTSPFAEEVLNHQHPADPKRPLLHITITSWGKTNHYITTATDSPPTRVLLDRLILLTGRKLPEGAMDAHRGY